MLEADLNVGAWQFAKAWKVAISYHKLRDEKKAGTVQTTLDKFFQRNYTL